jgi:hypothetical protein
MMLIENSPDADKVLESLEEASGFCSNCRGIAHFIVKGFGYLKQCPICGHSERLYRRPLKFDKQSRQWL